MTLFFRFNFNAKLGKILINLIEKINFIMKNVKYSLRGQGMAMELCPIKLKRGLFRQNRSRKWWSFKRRAPKVKRC